MLLGPAFTRREVSELLRPVSLDRSGNGKDGFPQPEQDKEEEEGCCLSRLSDPPCLFELSSNKTPLDWLLVGLHIVRVKNTNSLLRSEVLTTQFLLSRPESDFKKKKKKKAL